MNGHWVIVVLVGCATAFILGVPGFNRPTWARSFTTAGRYYTGAAMHAGIYALLLLIFYAVTRRAMRGYDGDWNSDTAKNFTLLIAVLLTVALRMVLPFSRRLRDSLQRMCGVTDQAGRFAAFLAGSSIAALPAVRAKASTMLSNRGIGTAESWIEPARPAYARLLQTTTLFLQLREWEDGADVRRFSGFVKEASNEFDQLRRRFDRLLVRAARARSSIDRIGTLKVLYSHHVAHCDVVDENVESFDEHLRRLIKDGIADLCEDIAVFHRDACLLAARGIMTVAPTRAARDRFIAGLGITPSTVRTPGAYAALGAAAVLLYVGACLFFLILPRQNPDIPQSVVNIIITVNVLGSLAIAILPKSRWGFATAGLHQKTPLPFLVGAGVCAVLFAVGVNLAAGAAVLGNWSGAMRRLHEGAPYLPSQFLTSATIVWLTQDHRWAHVASGHLRRLRDALTLAPVWMVAGAVAELLQASPTHSFALGRVIGAFVFGAIVGYVVPGSVRHDVLGAGIRRFDLPLSDFDGPAAAEEPAPWATPARSNSLQPQRQAVG